MIFLTSSPTNPLTHPCHVQALVTPLGALFWTLFDDPSCGAFEWLPHTNATVYFSIGGIVMMVPAIFLYNIGYAPSTMMYELDPSWCMYQVTGRVYLDRLLCCTMI